MQDVPASDVPESDVDAFEVAVRDLVGLALRSLEPVGDQVTLRQFRLLHTLFDLGCVPSSEAATALGVAASSVTRLADKLHASGHLTRGSDPGNRSVVTLTLTATGHDLVTQARNRRRQDLRRVLEGLDPAQRTSCAEGLRTVHVLLEARGLAALAHAPF
jgi:DNA-binding MarR family transcriptional regulator